MPKTQISTSDMIPTTDYQLSSTNGFADHRKSEEYSNFVSLNPNEKGQTNGRNPIKLCNNQKDCSELSSCHIKEWLEKQISYSAKHEHHSSRILELFDLLQNSENCFPSTGKEKNKTVFITYQF